MFTYRRRQARAIDLKTSPVRDAIFVETKPQVNFSPVQARYILDKAGFSPWTRGATGWAHLKKQAHVQAPLINNLL